MIHGNVSEFKLLGTLGELEILAYIVPNMENISISDMEYSVIEINNFGQGLWTFMDLHVVIQLDGVTLGTCIHPEREHGYMSVDRQAVDALDYIPTPIVRAALSDAAGFIKRCNDSVKEVMDNA